MITLLSNSGLGVCEYSITKIEELNEIDKGYILPTSKVTLCDSTGVRTFMLSSDKTEWVEIHKAEGTTVKVMAEAEYEALTSEEKNNGVVYLVY